MYIYYTKISVASYMFRPSIVAIFREVFFEGYIAQNVKKYTDNKKFILNKNFKIYAKI